MTYTRFTMTDLSDERWIEAGSDAFALHAWALTYCDDQDSDGVISKRMAGRVAFPVAGEDVTTAIDTLVRLGFWTEDGDAYQIVDYFQHCLAASEKDATREKWAQSKRRQRLHNIGNHDLCDEKKCLGVRGGVPGGHRDSIPNQNRTDQTRPEGSGSGAVGAEPASADAQPVDPWADTTCRNCGGVRFTAEGDCLNCGWGRR